MKQSKILAGALLYISLFALSDPGDLINYNHQNTLSVTVIEFVMNSLGTDLTLPVYPISIYDIQYESHRPDGTIDTLAGLLSIPQSPLEAFPILSYQHGTTSLDSEAPSITGMSLDNFEVTLIGLISSSSGFISIFPDYEGLGQPDIYHPYIISDSYTRAVVNMVRSVKELSFELEGNDRFQFNEQLFLLGYSEGGYATLAAQRGIQLYHSDEMTVTASFPMAGPYDLATTMIDYFLSIPSYSSPYYVPYVLTSHLWYYEGTDVEFEDYFESFWADTLPSLYDGTHSGDEINALMPENPLDILLPDVLEDFESNEDHFFRQTLQQNTLLDWIPESPTYFYHGLGDDIITYDNAQVAYDTFLNNGAEEVNLILIPEEFGGHAEVAVTCLLEGFDIIMDYQAISIKGDINSDGLVTLNDLSLLTAYTLLQNILTEFEFWAGDLDYDNNHSIIDLLMVAEAIQ